MTKDFEVSGAVSLKAGDLSGIDAINAFRKSSAQAHAELEQIKQSGGLSAFGIGADAVDAAQTQLLAMTTQAALLQKQIVSANLSLAEMDSSSPNYEAQQAKVAKLVKQFQDLNEAISEVPSKLTSYDESFSRVSNQASVYGDIESNVRASAGLVGMVGGQAGGQFEQVAGVAAEAAALAEALPRLETGFVELTRRGAGLVDAFKQGAQGADTAIGAIKGGVGGLVTATGPFVIVAGLAVAALGAFAIILNTLNDRAEKAKEAMRAVIDLQKSDNELRQRAAQLLAEGNTAELRALADAAAAQKELADQNIAFVEQQKKAVDARLEELAHLGVGISEMQEFNDKRAIQADLTKQLKDAELERTKIMQTQNTLFEYLPDAAEIENATVALEDQMEAIARKAQLDRQVADMVASASSSQVNDRIDSIGRERAVIEDQISAYRELVGQSTEAWDAIVQLQGQLGNLAEEEAALTNTVAPLVRLRELEAESVANTIAGLDQRIQRELETNRLLKEGTSDQIDDRLAAIDEERAAINAILPELTRLAQTSDEAAAALQGYQDRLSQLGGEQSLLETVKPDVMLREQQQALADMAEAEIESNEKIKEIRAAGQEQLIAAEDKFNKRLIDLGAQRDKAITAANNKENKAIADTQASFFKDSKTRYNDFYTEMAQREQDYKDSILKIRDDLNRQLTQAERANDVVAYIRAQEAADAQLTQLGTNFEKENQQRVAQFQAETAQRQAEFEERLGQIRTQAIAEREEQQARYLEARGQAAAQFEDEKTRLAEQTQQRIAGEEAALTKRLTSISEKYNQESALVDQFMKQRRKALGEETEALKASDKERADSRIEQEKRIGEEGQKVARDASNNKAKLETEAARIVARDMQTAFTVTITAIRQQLQVLAAEAGQLLAQARSAASSRNAAPGGSGSKGAIDNRNPLANRNQPTAYANEGFVTVADGPRLGLIGEDLLPGQVEAVIKFKPSEGLEGLGGRLGGGTVFDFSGMTIGAGMNRNEVEDALRTMAGAIIQGISKQRRSS